MSKTKRMLLYAQMIAWLTRKNVKIGSIKTASPLARYNQRLTWLERR
jgi:hypothetical protein